MKRIYVDLDGCLAKWPHFNYTMDEMREDGFYSALKPQQNLVAALLILMTMHPVYIISHYLADAPHAKKKNERG